MKTIYWYGLINDQLTVTQKIVCQLLSSDKTWQAVTRLHRDRSLFSGGGGVGGRNHVGGSGPIFSKTRGGPKENFPMIGGGSLCDCEE